MEIWLCISDIIVSLCIHINMDVLMLTFNTPNVYPISIRGRWALLSRWSSRVSETGSRIHQYSILH